MNIMYSEGITANSRKSLLMKFLILVSTLMVLASCHRDDNLLPPVVEPPVDPTASEVLFEINLPQSQTPGTYALTKEDEDKITSIEILLFKIEGANSKKYTGKPYFTDKIESGTGTDSHKKYFIASLPKGGPYDIVVLANSRATVNTVLAPAQVQAGALKEDVLKLLTFEHSTKWDTSIPSTNSNYVAIPMWGTLDNKTITTNLKFTTRLMRMLAKIDVALSTPAAKASLLLQEVNLANRNTVGHIIPFTSSIPSGTIIAPSLPTAPKPIALPLTYTEASEPNQAFEGVIYTFEANKTVSGSWSSATCLILKGIYTGDTEPSYYRIDFGKRETDGTTTYFDILRNMRYSVNISKIGGPGYKTYDEAIVSPSSNIEANVLVWDHNELPVVVFNNQNMLGFSSDDIIVPFIESQLERLKVRTDYIGGWKVDKIVDAADALIGWLTIPVINSSGVVNVTANVPFHVELYDGMEPRICYIHVSAGILKHKIKVTQMPMTRVSTVVWDDYLGTDFNTITIEDNLGNIYTSAVNTAGVLVSQGVETPLDLGEGIVSKVTSTYKSYVLEVPTQKHTHDNSTRTLTILDRTLIGLPIHLHKIREDMKGHYIQVDDINLVGYTNWVPIGSTMPNSFTGSYDGGSGNGDTGFKISELYINRPTEDYIGLFGGASGSFKNIHITSGNIVGRTSVGSIAGQTYEAVTITGCTNAAPVTGYAFVGGIIGYTRSNIFNCENTGKIIGIVDGTSINVNGIGGICGYNFKNVINNCTNTGEILADTGNSQSVGGIIGQNNYGDILNSTNTGKVTGTSSVGGICGFQHDILNGTGLISGCTNTGIIEGTGATSNSIGGICGRNVTRGKILNSTNKGEVKGLKTGVAREQYIAGICGYNDAGEISGCTNEAPVTGTHDFVGGISGNNIGLSSKIIDCHNLSSATIKGNKYVGGISGNSGSPGTSAGSTTTSTNEAVITGSSDYVGGIVGCLSGSLTACINTATVSGVNKIGGICGGGYSLTIEACYNIGLVTGTAEVGAIVGFKESLATLTFCYYGGAAAGVVAPLGAIKFSAVAWPTEDKKGWRLYNSSTNPLGNWFSLGDWNNASPIWPTLIDITTP